MGRKSVKENKNMYHICREEAGLTREQASELMEFVSSDRIERIENDKSPAQPDEVLAMSKCYKHPELCNYFCSHECPIGEKYIPEVHVKDLSQIVLETIATLNALNKEKDRLIEIAADGKIDPDELSDFKRISKQLDKISLVIDSLKLWVETTIMSGNLEFSQIEE